MNLILLQITCLVYAVLLNIFYFSKSHISNIENKIYQNLLILNVVGLIIELGCFWSVSHLNIIPAILNTIITRSLLVYYLLFIAIYSIYVFVISNKNENEDQNKLQKYYNDIKQKSLIGFIICSIIICYLPMEYYYDGNYIYSYGPATDFLAIILIIVMGFWIAILAKKFHNIKVHKYFPVIIFIVLAGIGGVIQKIYPQILLTTPIETLVVFLMYFTIENPDMKLLEEVHKSKEISDTANEEKTMFLYNMTQEIRNTTGEINSSANEILDSNSIEENKDSARDIIATTSKFTSMTNEILDVSQIDNETIKTYNSKYDIKNTLKQLVNIYNEESKKKMLEFRTNIDHDIPDNLYGDSISLKDALNKILRNSLNNTNTGYIEFNVNTIIKNDICRLIITIEDSGNGIRSEELNTIKKDNKLLSEANSLIGVMQGTLMISSDYGVGTKVKVILDQKIVDSEETKEVTKYVNTLDNVNVLVCDTESGLKVISKLLDGSNVKLDKVDNGKELLETVKENKYDLVLMDESTSTNNGILVSKIKAIRNFNSEIILLTRDNSYEYNDEYKNQGFDDYILKPLKKDILLEKINKYKDN